MSSKCKNYPFFTKHQGPALADCSGTRKNAPCAESCTAVCPVHAIELGVFRKTAHRGRGSLGLNGNAIGNVYKTSIYGIRQRTDRRPMHCVGCGMCSHGLPQ